MVNMSTDASFGNISGVLQYKNNGVVGGPGGISVPNTLTSYENIKLSGFPVGDSALQHQNLNNASKSHTSGGCNGNYTVPAVNFQLMHSIGLKIGRYNELATMNTPDKPVWTYSDFQFASIFHNFDVPFNVVTDKSGAIDFTIGGPCCVS